jgi:glycosyltransferase involved in cell wall biosynthesis
VKIGFDAKRFFNNFTGLGNYSRFVINALSEYATENEYVLYSPKVKRHPEFDSILSRPNVQVITPPSVYTFLFAKSLWRTWGISRETSVQKLNVYHGLSQELPVNLPKNVFKVVTVHDLIFIRYPQLYNFIDVSIYKAKVKAACKQADRVLAISRQTADDVVDFLKINPSKVEVVYQGCHPNFKKKFSSLQVREIRALYDLPEEYILSVGTIEERKNVLLLIKALSLLSSDLQAHVVIIGRPTSYRDKIVAEAQRLGVIERIIFLHDVSFADLPAIYQGATLFVYPSLFEGFGIPIVEALESSVPVIAATGSCLEEAGGAGSIYVNPRDADELARQITRVMQDSQLRAEMIAAGKQHIAQFTPQQVTKKLLAIYNSAH